MSPGLSFTGEENYPKQPKWRAKFFLVIYSNNITTGLRKFRRKSPVDRCRFATAITMIQSPGPGHNVRLSEEDVKRDDPRHSKRNAGQEKFSVG